MRKFFLRWPTLTLAFLVAGGFCLPGAGGAMLDSQPSKMMKNASTLSELKQETVGAYLKNMGWDGIKTEDRLSHLSEGEIHDLALSLEKVIAGAGEEDKKAIGVGLVLLITLGLITGVYLFSTAN